MKYRILFIAAFYFVTAKICAQPCNCEQEFLDIKSKMEQNYAGFKDKLAVITRPVYDKKTNRLLQLAKNKSSKEKCILIISTYLGLFKDEHVSLGFGASGNVAVDSAMMINKEMIDIPPAKMQALRSSKEVEGIYYYRHDSSYKIAVIKSPTALRDYVAVMLESKFPQWKKGMVKFEAKKESAELMKGVLYLRNHMAKTDWFFIGKNNIGGDWQREGTMREIKSNEPYVSMASKLLSPQTIYIKISSFGAGNAKNIDSLFKANKTILDTIPNLILDLRDNGGGADFAYSPLLPYIYTNPVKTVGVDALSTDLNIQTWNKILEMKDLPDETKDHIRGMITKMENNKGKFVNIVDDETDSSFTVLPYPKKIIVLVNKGCASTTEQFLLSALQSKKVKLMGEHTGGVLDYANVRDAGFSCMPYELHYASTRSRRINIKQGIDNVGIKPHLYPKTDDWIAEALKILED